MPFSTAGVGVTFERWIRLTELEFVTVGVVFAQVVGGTDDTCELDDAVIEASVCVGPF